MKEIWRDAVGFEGLYEISDLGRLRSIERVSKTRNRWGEMRRRFPGKILTTSPDDTGYPQATLCVRGERHQRHIHSLVAEAFIGPRPVGLHVLHRDGVKSNCRLKNIRYGTPRENSFDSIVHGHQVRGVDQGSARFTERDIRKIRALRGKMFQKDVAKMFGTSRQYIGLIQRRKWWAHVR